MIMQRLSSADRKFAGAIVLGSAVLFVATVQAQTNPLPTKQVNVLRSSGTHDNPTTEFQLVYETVIRTGGDAPWVRLRFADAHLDGESYIRVISEQDGAVQHLHADHLLEWRMTSAYFNGQAVGIELFAAPDTEGNFFEITEISVGLPPDDGPYISTQCGETDDRVLSDEPSSGRLIPIGCTGTIYNEASCAVTAGHCLDSADVWEFNVPLSNENGTINHPGPEDQYAVDASSRIGMAAGVGNDWGHYVCFANSETGLLPFEAQGALTPLAKEIPALPMDIKIEGYGLDFDQRNRSQVQQLSLGPVVHTTGSVGHRADTEGGNSGSAIVDLGTGTIIGIHTHGGCSNAPDSFNSGTLITHPGLQEAVIGCLGIEFEYPNGLVRFVDPTIGATLLARITGIIDEPDPQTVTLRVSIDGGPFADIPMDDLGESQYEASIAAVECGTKVNYYITLETFGGATITDPSSAPANTYPALGATGATVLLNEDFEAPKGYAVSGDAITGQWEVGIPVACNRGDPPNDFDNSGNCYLTENDPDDCDSDVDMGSTILTSPIFDMTGEGEPYVTYARWYSNILGGAPETDIFVVGISNDGGANWTNLETVGPSGPEVTGGWIVKTFRVADTIEPTNEMRLRWNASDLNTGSVVEAAVDGLIIELVECDDESVRLLPEEFDVVRGRHSGGELADLFDSDNSRLEFFPGLTQNPDEPPVWLTLTGQSFTDSPTELRFIVESRVDTPAVTQRVSLFNYNTQQFEEVDVRSTTREDSSAEIIVGGDPSRFIDSKTLEIRAELTYKPPPLVLLFPWTVGIDQAVWRVVP